MKTIILCGGKGMRLHQETEFKPKPMVRIGDQPILVHIMNLYHQFGHTEFVLALGYMGEYIRDYFLHIQKYSNDFSYDVRTGEIIYHTKHVKLPFTITFVNTGDETLSGERVQRSSVYVPEDRFMITYGDGVSSVNIQELIAFHDRQREAYGTIATITAVHPSSKYGQIAWDDRNIITVFDEKPVLNDYINGGFMVFEKEALSFLRPGEMLETGLKRMVEVGKLAQFNHQGFWHSMDTMKDVLDLNALWDKHQTWNI